MAKTKDGRVPLTSTSKPKGSTTPPPPPSAPLPPPPCPPPLSEYYKNSDYVKSIHVSSRTTKHKEWLLNKWLNCILSTINPPFNDMTLNKDATSYTPPPPPPCRHNDGQCFGCNKSRHIQHGCTSQGNKHVQRPGFVDLLQDDLLAQSSSPLADCCL
jgi:hypothetical protein